MDTFWIRIQLTIWGIELSLVILRQIRLVSIIGWGSQTFYISYINCLTDSTYRIQDNS